MALSTFIEANYQGQQLENEMANLERYMKYEWQDVYEKMATQILKHYWYEHNFKQKFNDGFKDVCIMAEEIYQIDEVANEPIFEKLNPLKVRALQTGGSNKLEDANLIIIEDHWSSGRIIDTYYNELKPNDIDKIMDYTVETGNGGFTDDDNNHTLLRDGMLSDDGTLIDSYLGMAEINGMQYNSRECVDADGNIRVFRVYWKSLKKVLKVKYYDELGNVQYKWRSEEYIPNKELGEETEAMWVNEIWEGTKIGKDIYLQMKPKKVQFNRLNNKSKCHAGIIGQVYNTNQSRGVSVMDRGKNLQLMYDVIQDRVRKLIATNYGKILEVDIAKIPNDWEMDKWMHFAVTNKIAIMDSFAVGTEGAATGKMAGSMNTVGGRTIDMDTGNSIQGYLGLLEFIKFEMGEITGVSQQRQGQISNRETVGGVERAVNQSSHITEYLYLQHDDVKRRCLEAFLQVAKSCLRGRNEKAQYILDDQTIEFLNLNGDMIADVDMGVIVTDSAKTLQMEQDIKRYAELYVQNGGRMSTIMDIYFSDSITDMRRKLETAEDDMMARQQQGQQEAAKAQQEAAAQAMELEAAKLELEREKNIRDNDTKLAIASLNAELNVYNTDANSNGISDDIDRAKLDLAVAKQESEVDNKRAILEQQKREHADKVDLEKQKIAKQNSNSGGTK